MYIYSSTCTFRWWITITIFFITRWFKLKIYHGDVIKKKKNYHGDNQFLKTKRFNCTFNYSSFIFLWILPSNYKIYIFCYLVFENSIILLPKLFLYIYLPTFKTLHILSSNFLIFKTNMFNYNIGFKMHTLKKWVRKCGKIWNL